MSTNRNIYDQFGRPISLGRYQKIYGYGTSPYATPWSTGQTNYYRPRYLLNNLYEDISAVRRAEIISYSVQFYCQLGNLAAAINQKALYAVGDAWKPQYIGENRKWGDEAEEFLIEQFYKIGDLRGLHDLTTWLFIDSICLDVYGDNLVVLSKNRDGYPMYKFIPGNRIGSRHENQEIKEGEYKGCRVVNGVVIGSNDRIRGYYFLGKTPEEDRIIDAYDCQLLFEPEWTNQYRGIPKIARAILDWADIQDIDLYLKRSVKLDSSVGLIKHVEGGIPDFGADLFEIDNNNPLSSVPVEVTEGGDFYYVNSRAGERIEPFISNRPTVSQTGFIDRLERRAIQAVCWFPELLDPSKIGGASVRLIQDQARAIIKSRQKVLKKRASRIINYAIAVAMKNGIISTNTKDWWKWSFELPAQITVDAGYDKQADIEDLKLGLTTEAAINSKAGKLWRDTRLQRKKEIELLLEMAQELSQKYNIPIQTALDLLHQRGGSISPIISPPLIVNETKPEKQENKGAGNEQELSPYNQQNNE